MKFKILSLDGGGSWALIQVMCLQAIYGDEIRGHELLSKFDLVAGNSGGSLVIAAMAENLKLSEILDLFTNEVSRNDIFKKYYSILTPFYKAAGIGPRYQTSKKLMALKKYLPNVSQISIFNLPKFIVGSNKRHPHFFIPAFDYNRKRAIFFRSNLDSNGVSNVLAKKLDIVGFGGSPDVTITDAAHASSTAPVNYFNKAAVLNNCDSSYWDGAIAGYNNPVLAATVEAIINGIEPLNVIVFSIGTGTTILPVGDKNHSFSRDELKLKLLKKDGFFSDVKKLATSIISAPPDAASYIAYTMLNPLHAVNSKIVYNNFIRANPQHQPILKGNKWVLPTGLSSDEFERLTTLDMDATKQQDVELIIKLCKLWLSNKLPNQPIRMDTSLQCLIGQSSFSQVQELVKKHID